MNKKNIYKSWKKAQEKQMRSLHEHHIEQKQTPKDYAYKYWKTHNTDTMLYWDKKNNNCFNYIISRSTIKNIILLKSNNLITFKKFSLQRDRYYIPFFN